MAFSHSLIYWFNQFIMSRVKWYLCLDPGRCCNIDLSFLPNLNALVCLPSFPVQTLAIWSCLGCCACPVTSPRSVLSHSGWQRQAGFRVKRNRVEERPWRRMAVKGKEWWAMQTMAVDALFCWASLQISQRGLNGSQLSWSPDDSPESPFMLRPHSHLVARGRQRERDI